MSATKTAGQLAYEADLAKQPRYHDATLRKTWKQLDELCRSSWERKPSPR